MTEDVDGVGEEMIAGWVAGSCLMRVAILPGEVRDGKDGSRSE